MTISQPYMYIYRTNIPKNKENTLLKEKWENILYGCDIHNINEHISIKLENLTKYTKENFYNRNIIKNGKIILLYIHDLFFELYYRNNSINEIDFIHKFDNFVKKHKYIFILGDENKITLYLNIFIETY
jgi:hypothetical protein